MLLPGECEYGTAGQGIAAGTPGFFAVFRSGPRGGAAGGMPGSSGGDTRVLLVRLVLPVVLLMLAVRRATGSGMQQG